MKFKRVTVAILAVSALLSATACASEKNANDSYESKPAESTSSYESGSESKAADSSYDYDSSSKEETSEAKSESKEPESFVTSEASAEENSAAPTEAFASTIEELNDIVAKDVDGTLSELTAEYEQIKTDIDTYDKYLANTEKIEEFYSKVNKTNNDLCIRMYEYSLNYAQIIVGSDKPKGDKYDDLGELYDNVYDDAGSEIYDEIYDGILDDMYKDFYDGILDDAYDTAPYAEWSDAHSGEYKMWSNTRSDVYESWSDFRSDVYDFWSDVRGKVFKDDMDKAEKRIEDFKKDVEKLKKR